MCERIMREGTRQAVLLRKHILLRLLKPAVQLSIVGGLPAVGLLWLRAAGGGKGSRGGGSG